MDRCKQLDAPDSIYPFRVGAALLFGSHAAGKETVGDVDILVKLEWRHRDFEEHQKDQQAFINHMYEQGRSIPWDAHLYWPRRQAMGFLKSRSRILALIEMDEGHLELALKGPHRLLYGSLKPTVGLDIQVRSSK